MPPAMRLAATVSRPEQVLLDPVVEQESDDGRGQEGDEHAQDEPLRGAARP